MVGSIIKYFGNEIAQQHAADLGVDDWGPDWVDRGNFGICEGLYSISLQGHKIYKCRFPNASEPGIHFTGHFFFFEIEAVEPCIK